MIDKQARGRLFRGIGNMRLKVALSNVQIDTIEADGHNIIAVDSKKRILVIRSENFTPTRLLYQANYVYVWSDGAFVVMKDRYQDMTLAIKELESVLGMRFDASEENRIYPCDEDLVILKLKGLA